MKQQQKFDIGELKWIWIILELLGNLIIQVPNASKMFGTDFCSPQVSQVLAQVLPKSLGTPMPKETPKASAAQWSPKLPQSV